MCMHFDITNGTSHNDVQLETKSCVAAIEIEWRGHTTEPFKTTVKN